MLSRSLKTTIGAALLSVTAGVASANVIDFTVAGSVTPIGAETGTFSMGTVQADAGCEGLPFCSPVITQLSSGLGVSVNALDDPAIDGFLLWESLTFDFFSKVKLKKIVFGSWDSEDDFSISVDGGTFTATGDTAEFSFGAGLVADSLSVFAYDAFEATGCSVSFGSLCLLPSGGPDDFTVSSIEVSAVPVPAAGFLLVGALGGLAAMRRRKKAE